VKVVSKIRNLKQLFQKYKVQPKIIEAFGQPMCGLVSTGLVTFVQAGIRAGEY
jgi:hypothetical protein